jgi:hydrogenase expression/formation protein HypD
MSGVKLKYIDDFRSHKAAKALGRKIDEAAGRVGRRLTFMEVCGTHTMAIFRHGLAAMLPDSLRLVSGPGCPVCVTPVSFIDHAVALSRLRRVTIATFGDLVRVPGSTSSLELEKSRGGDIRVVYSPLDVLDMAQAERSNTFVFLGVGFETTAPLIASCVLEAERRGVGNFKVLAAPKRIPPAMRALVTGGLPALDGFLCPAHVSAIIGMRAYDFLASELGTPCVITGFEPLDILMGLDMLVAQRASGRSEVENQYSRVVKPDGNPTARAVLYSVFEDADAQWRGLGLIRGSGLEIKDELYHRDAARAIPVEVEEPSEDRDCRCGDVLRGLIAPPECGLFARRCTPQTPVGACMVSSEGACAAHFKYGRGGGS